MTLGEKLKAARLEKGMTQKEVAKVLRLSHSSISEWENDKHRPDADTIEVLLGLYGLSASDLLGDYTAKSRATIISEMAFDNDALDMISKYILLDNNSKKAVKHIVNKIIGIV